MKAVRATLITFALLGSVWIVLGVIGAIAGVLPDLPGGGVEADAGTLDAAVDDAAIDAGVDAVAVADAGVDAPDPEADAAEPPPPDLPPGTAHRFRVCDYPDTVAHVFDGSFTVGELLAGGPPEIVVGCADRFVVIGIAVGPTGMMGMRLAELTLETTRDVVKHTARPAIADITGDGKRDLLLPFFFESDGGGSRGGRLVLWPRAESGFGRSRPLGQHTFQDVTPIDLDGRGGMDFVVVDRGRPWANAAGAVRVFQGGTQPRQRTQNETGISPRHAVVADIDLDGENDLVTISSGFTSSTSRSVATVHVMRRTGPFGFEHSEVSAERHWGLLSGDLNDDGHDDLIVGGAAGLAAIYARQRDDLNGLALEPLSTVTGAPTPLVVADVDGDGLNDLIVGRRGGLSWHPRTATGFRGGQRYVADNVAGAAMIHIDGEPVLVWGRIEGGHLDLVVVQRPTFSESIPDQAHALHDAPFLARSSVR